jgi:myosin-crossreactive antigen
MTTTRFNSTWDLFDTMPGVEAVEAALNKAWEEAKVLAPELPSKERAKLAAKHVRKVMEKYADFGATDTEPDSILFFKIQEHFGTDTWRWDV